MTAIELARFLMLYPEADVLVDTAMNGRNAIRRIDLQKSVLASNDLYAVLVVEDLGNPRAEKVTSVHGRGKATETEAKKFAREAAGRTR